MSERDSQRENKNENKHKHEHANCNMQNAQHKPHHTAVNPINLFI